MSIYHLFNDLKMQNLLDNAKEVVLTKNQSEVDQKISALRKEVNSHSSIWETTAQFFYSLFGKETELHKLQREVKELETAAQGIKDSAETVTKIGAATLAPEESAPQPASLERGMSKNQMLSSRLLEPAPPPQSLPLETLSPPSLAEKSLFFPDRTSKTWDGTDPREVGLLTFAFLQKTRRSQLEDYLRFEEIQRGLTELAQSQVQDPTLGLKEANLERMRTSGDSSPYTQKQAEMLELLLHLKYVETLSPLEREVIDKILKNRSGELFQAGQPTDREAIKTEVQNVMRTRLMRLEEIVEKSEVDKKWVKQSAAEDSVQPPSIISACRILRSLKGRRESLTPEEKAVSEEIKDVKVEYSQQSVLFILQKLNAKEIEKLDRPRIINATALESRSTMVKGVAGSRAHDLALIQRAQISEAKIIAFARDASKAPTATLAHACRLLDAAIKREENTELLSPEERELITSLPKLDYSKESLACLLEALYQAVESSSEGTWSYLQTLFKEEEAWASERIQILQKIRSKKGLEPEEAQLNTAWCQAVLNARNEVAVEKLKKEHAELAAKYGIQAGENVPEVILAAYHDTGQKTDQLFELIGGRKSEETQGVLATELLDKAAEIFALASNETETQRPFAATVDRELVVFPPRVKEMLQALLLAKQAGVIALEVGDESSRHLALRLIAGNQLMGRLARPDTMQPQVMDEHVTFHEEFAQIFAESSRDSEVQILTERMEVQLAGAMHRQIEQDLLSKLQAELKGMKPGAGREQSAKIELSYGHAPLTITFSFTMKLTMTSNDDASIVMSKAFVTKGGIKAKLSDVLSAKGEGDITLFQAKKFKNLADYSKYVATSITAELLAVGVKGVVKHHRARQQVKEALQHEKRAIAQAQWLSDFLHLKLPQLFQTTDRLIAGRSHLHVQPIHIFGMTKAGEAGLGAKFSAIELGLGKRIAKTEKKAERFVAYAEFLKRHPHIIRLFPPPPLRVVQTSDLSRLHSREDYAQAIDNLDLEWFTFARLCNSLEELKELEKEERYLHSEPIQHKINKLKEELVERESRIRRVAGVPREQEAAAIEKRDQRDAAWIKRRKKRIAEIEQHLAQFKPQHQKRIALIERQIEEMLNSREIPRSEHERNDFLLEILKMRKDLIDQHSKNLVDRRVHLAKKAQDIELSMPDSRPRAGELWNREQLRQDLEQQKRELEERIQKLDQEILCLAKLSEAVPIQTKKGEVTLARKTPRTPEIPEQTRDNPFISSLANFSTPERDDIGPTSPFQREISAVKGTRAQAARQLEQQRAEKQMGENFDTFQQYVRVVNAYESQQAELKELKGTKPKNRPAIRAAKDEVKKLQTEKHRIEREVTGHSGGRVECLRTLMANHYQFLLTYRDMSTKEEFAAFEASDVGARYEREYSELNLPLNDKELWKLSAKESYEGEEFKDITSFSFKFPDLADLPLSVTLTQQSVLQDPNIDNEGTYLNISIDIGTGDNDSVMAISHALVEALRQGSLQFDAHRQGQFEKNLREILTQAVKTGFNAALTGVAQEGQEQIKAAIQQRAVDNYIDGITDPDVQRHMREWREEILQGNTDQILEKQLPEDLEEALSGVPDVGFTFKANKPSLSIQLNLVQTDADKNEYELQYCRTLRTLETALGADGIPITPAWGVGFEFSSSNTSPILEVIGPHTSTYIASLYHGWMRGGTVEDEWPAFTSIQQNQMWNFFKDLAKGSMAQSELQALVDEAELDGKTGVTQLWKTFLKECNAIPEEPLAEQSERFQKLCSLLGQLFQETYAPHEWVGEEPIIKRAKRL